MVPRGARSLTRGCSLVRCGKLGNIIFQLGTRVAIFFVGPFCNYFIVGRNSSCFTIYNGKDFFSGCGITTRGANPGRAFTTGLRHGRQLVTQSSTTM